MVQVQLPSGVSVYVGAIVVASKPLDFDFILGMNGVRSLRCVRVCLPNDVWFGIENFGFGCSGVFFRTIH